MMKNTFLGSVLALGMAVVQADTAPTAEMKPANIALFKNGYSFVTMQGTLPDGSAVELKPLPVPTLGTFWLETGQGVEIARTVSSLRSSQQPSPFITASFMAAANPNAAVCITLKGGRVLSGELVSTPRPKSANENTNLIGGEPGKEIPPRPIEPFFVRTLPEETGTPVASMILVNPDEIIEFEFVDAKTMKMPTVEVQIPVVTLELKKPSPGGQVRATCIARGITWHPSYKMNLGDDGKAYLEAQATIINNLMDMDGVSLELITGFPSLEYARQTDPIAQFPKGIMRNTVNMMMGDMGDGYAENKAPVAMGFLGAAAPINDALEKMPVDGVQSEDLFFYPVEKFSAKTGEVVAVPLFASEVDYKHIYTWDVKDPCDNAEVWHCIRMKNVLSIPLTKAPVEFITQNRIAGQNTMPYTPAKGDCTIKMNKAVNVITEQNVSLIKREKYRGLRNSDTYRTENEVTLSLENCTDKEIVVEIRKQLKGIVSQASDDAKTSVEGNLRNPENPSSTVQWTLRLKPGERKNVNYRYLYVG